MASGPEDEINDAQTNSIYYYPSFMKAHKPLWIILAALVICFYLFLELQVINRDYLLPSVERLRYSLGLSYDATSATVMALSTSVPAISVHLFSTFLTRSDMGIGTVLGSAIFNSLALYACSGLAPGVNMSTDWWIISRDVICFLVSVVLLSVFVMDARIYWYESMIMVVGYVLNVVYMIFDRHVEDWVRGPFTDEHGNYRKKPHYGRTSLKYARRPIASAISEAEDDTTYYLWCFVPTGVIPDMKPKNFNPDDDPVFFYNFWKCPVGFWRRVLWVLEWPLSWILYYTIPDCRRANLKQLFILTWILSITWMSVLSYLLSWMVTVLAFHTNLPDTVLGLTLLAAGTKVPETIDVVLQTQQGHHASGICSSTVDILLCLGAPWLLKALLAPTVPSDLCVQILSHGIIFLTIGCTLVMFYLYLVLMFTRFTVGPALGWFCLIGYVVFVSFASYFEVKFMQS